MRSMEELFYALLQDVYFVEKQLLKTLPKLAKKSTNEKLREAFTTHRDETEGHVKRLEKVFNAIGKKPPRQDLRCNPGDHRGRPGNHG
jgi:ferritin-like metal-binding protein YciE